MSQEAKLHPPETEPPTSGGGTAQANLPKLSARDVSFYYGSFKALHGISLEMRETRITALIGPSGCGKSTFLRTLNRMYETVRGTRLEGKIFLDGSDILEEDVTAVRLKVGMVFQRSNPFPKSIFENVAYGLHVNGYNGGRQGVREVVERSLRKAALWDEVKDKLHQSAYGLSGGQQQRLCIARALAVDPEVLLLDEPCSALDPIATAKIEDLLFELKIGMHHRDRHAQHAAGGPRFRLHGVLPAGQADRVRFHQHDFPEPGAEGDRGLCHGTVRIASGGWKDWGV